MEIRKVKVNGKYRHFKGFEIEVVAIAYHSETLEELVIYNHDNKTWARPIDLFLSEVDRNKYPNIKQKYRFEEIKESGEILDDY